MILAGVLNEVGISLGLPGLAFSRDNIAALQLGEADTLFFERLGEGVLMSLSRPLPPHRPDIAVQALRLCAPGRGWPLPVRAGLSRDNRLVFSLRFTERSFSVTGVSQCLTLLRGLQEQAAR